MTKLTFTIPGYPYPIEVSGESINIEEIIKSNENSFMPKESESNENQFSDEEHAAIINAMYKYYEEKVIPLLNKYCSVVYKELQELAIKYKNIIAIKMCKNGEYVFDPSYQKDNVSDIDYDITFGEIGFSKKALLKIDNPHKKGTDEYFQYIYDCRNKILNEIAKIQQKYFSIFKPIAKNIHEGITNLNAKKNSTFIISLMHIDLNVNIGFKK
jgi:hypothetical protein